MLSQGSVDALNSKLSERGVDMTVTAERFRPNIIVKGNLTLALFSVSNIKYTEKNTYCVPMGSAHLLITHLNMTWRCDI